jgi:KipI family sensor histidine kinase inhibitor
MKTEGYATPKYLPFGESALLVEFGDTINLEVNRKVFALCEAIERTKIQGIEELVPTYRSLLVRYSLLKTTYEKLVFSIKALEKTLEALSVKTIGKKVIVPVVYGGDYGPDIGDVARYHGLKEEQVVTLHSERKYHVYMLGFITGFPYLGEVADEIATPRLKTPRLKVPAGSVGIAEKQTGIYPREAPGGWRIIGRTPIKLFNPLQQPPALLSPGDKVRFKPVTEKEYKKLENAIKKGEYKLRCGG